MNRTLLESLNNDSLRILSQQAPNHLIWVLLSPFAILSNFFVILVISCTKRLHNKSQYLLLTYSVIEMMNACSHFGTGLARCLAYEFGMPETSNQVICMLKMSPITFCGRATLVYALALAADRCFCVAFPVLYRVQNSFRYILKIHVLIWVFMGTKVPMAFVGLDIKKLYPTCNYVTVFTKFFSDYSNFELPALTGATAGMYILAAAILFIRYKRKKFSSLAQKTEWKRQIEFDAFMAVMAIGVIYLVSSGMTAALISIASQIGTLEASVTIAPVTSVFAFLTSVSHLFVYIRFNPEFRAAFVRLVLKCGKASVAPM